MALAHALLRGRLARALIAGMLEGTRRRRASKMLLASLAVASVLATATQSLAVPIVAPATEMSQASETHRYKR